MSNYKSNLQSNNNTLSANNLDLQSLIEQANALPDAGGVELPELINEGSASDLISGKELISSDGNVVIGTIETFDGSYECSGESTGGGGGGGEVDTCTITISGGVYTSIAIGYTDANGQCQTATNDGQYTCQKDSFVAAVDYSFATGIFVSGGEILVNDEVSGLFYYIKATNDITITGN